MKFKPFYFLFFCLSAFSVNGAEPQKKNHIKSTRLQSQLMDEKVSELMADRVNINKNIVVNELASMEFHTPEEIMESEALRFPADELYGSWDTCWVNPFRSKEVAFPDSFYIDCSSFVPPIDNSIRITSNYGPRRRRMHRGIDLKVYVGDTIRSVFSGKVRVKGYERRGYGNYLVVRHPNGLETIYGHLSKFLVSENDIVMAGEAIALGGNTGRSTGAHLHFETRFLGHAINPSTIIDFENGVPHKDYFVFQKGSIKQNNVYTSTSERIVYHRVKKGETLSKIASKYKISVSELCRLNGIKPKSKLRIGQSIRCGTAPTKKTNQKELSSSIETNTQASTQNGLFHKVESNETLNSIAKKYGTSVDEICRLNNIHSTTALTVGQSICYRKTVNKTVKQNEIIGDEENIENQAERKSPNTDYKPSYHRVKKGETLSAVARTYNTSVDELCRLNGLSKKSQLSIGQKICYKASDSSIEENTKLENTSEKTNYKIKNTVYYRVKQGDTLGAIAQKHGITVDQLCKMNNITKTTILKIGRSLRCS